MHRQPMGLNKVLGLRTEDSSVIRESDGEGRGAAQNRSALTAGLPWPGYANP